MDTKKNIGKREPKRPMTIRILQILEKYSDSEHLLKQKDIIAYLYNDYGLNAERKAVSNNLSVLKDMGYNIVQEGRKGAYLAQRKFSQTELRYLIDALLGSKHISFKEKEALIDKILALGGVNFTSHLENIKSLDQSNVKDFKFIETIEILQKAIDNKWKLRMRYCKWDINKELVSSTSTRKLISPYGLVLHNQRYYLIANYPKYNNFVFLRVDKICDIVLTKEPIRPVAELDNYDEKATFDQVKNRLPYLFPDKVVSIKLKCDMKITDDIIDWFGFDVKMAPIDEKFFFATIKASPKAMEYWLMQYCNYTEVITPVSLRYKIQRNIRDMVPKYFSYNSFIYFKRLIGRIQKDENS